MVQDWYVGQVTLRVVWPLPGLAEPSLKTAAGLRPVVDRLLKVSVEIGLYGPVLIAYDRHGKPDERAGGEEDWAVYADTIGGTAPPLALHSEPACGHGALGTGHPGR